MGLAPWALFLAAYASGAASTDSCQGLYKAEYASFWELKPADWEADCAAGRGPVEILKARQQAFVRSCSGRFAAQTAAGKVHQTTVEAYCAQGVDGRRHLLKLYEPPSADAGTPAAESAAAEWRPTEGGMGPMARAVEEAKRRAGKSACLAGMTLSVDFAQTCRGDEFREGFKCTVGPVRAFRYVFLADYQEWPLLVGYEDAISSWHCGPDEALKGPVIDNSGLFKGHGCLSKVEIDLEQAVGAARKTGLSFKGRVRAVLGRGRGFSDLVRSTNLHPCKPLSKRQLRAVEGKDAWLLWSDGKVVAVDAAKGNVLFSAEFSHHCMPVGGSESVPAACWR